MSVARLLALSYLAIASHACGPAVQLASSAAVGAFLGYSGLRKGSLSRSGKPIFLEAPHAHPSHTPTSCPPLLAFSSWHRS